MMAPMKRIPAVRANGEPPKPMLGKAPPKPVLTKTPSSSLFDETPPFEEDALDKSIEAQGSPYGAHSGKQRRVPKNAKNADGYTPKIPLEDRAAYVAYSRLAMAGIQLKNVLTCLSHAPGVDKQLVEQAYKLCMQAADGPFLALGMDREFNLLLGDRRPETSEVFQ
jgi:hypothetical protein